MGAMVYQEDELMIYCRGAAAGADTIRRTVRNRVGMLEQPEL
jgi:hypothetical protein